MTLKSIGGGFVIEVSSVHAFVKLGRWEVYVDFSWDKGPAGRRFVVERVQGR